MPKRDASDFEESPVKNEVKELMLTKAECKALESCIIEKRAVETLVNAIFQKSKEISQKESKIWNAIGERLSLDTSIVWAADTKTGEIFKRGER